MCRLCDLYGDGGVWYMNPANYSRQLYRLRRPGETPKGPEENPERITEAKVQEAIQTKMEEPERWEELLREADEHCSRVLAYQVVPLEEAKKIVHLAAPLASMHCICRKTGSGIEETNEDEYSCLGLGVGMLKWERWPERYRGGVHFLSPEEAEEWLEKWDKRGFVHLAMTFGVPYIGGLCNCQYPDCAEVRYPLDYDFKYRDTKSHFVAELKPDLCNGCGVCAQRCQYGALKFEPKSRTPTINMLRCWGCGLCQTGCPREAIELISRDSIPVLANEIGYRR